MTLNLQKFLQACNPARTLAIGENTLDRKYYIDFSSVRGGKIIQELGDNITLFSPDDPTCQLFTGHIGCGKSTELLRLKAELEEKGFHVVYFESSEDLELEDVDISDILLSIARRVSESIEKIKINDPIRLKDLLNGAVNLLNTEIDVSGGVGVNGIGKIKYDPKQGVSVSAGIGELTVKAKESVNLRSLLRQYLEPRTKVILDAINQELLEPATKELKRQGKKGLVVIVDNLDKLATSEKSGGRTQPEYLFVDEGEPLRKLNCHVVYTIPLSLIFSNELWKLNDKFGTDSKVLPMVPVSLRDGGVCEQGMALLRQMVLARAFPDFDEQQRKDSITEVFDSPETLDRLCRISGGHVRNLLRLLSESIKKERGLPISRNSLEAVIKKDRNDLTIAISDDEWELLRQVAKQKNYKKEAGYQTLLRSMFIFGYRDRDESWFDINPSLAEAKGFME